VSLSRLTSGQKWKLSALFCRASRLVLLHDPALPEPRTRRQQVIASKRIGRFPFLAVTVAAFERRVVAGLLVGVIFPDEITISALACVTGGVPGIKQET